MGRHVRTAPSVPVDAPFLWAMATALPMAGSVALRHRPGRHLAITEPLDPPPPTGTRHSPAPRLPVRPRKAPEANRFPVHPADRPDLDTMRRVLAALQRL